jgi:hypothetical protein
MTAVTISALRGVDGMSQPLAFTIETTAPTASFDFEVRYNLLDQNSVAVKKIDLIKFLQAVVYGIETGTIFFPQANTGSNFVAPVL